jgi:hypothetical protein
MQKALHYGQPIAWENPLNRGLVSRWKYVPWYASGPRWMDLADKNHGVLTGGPSWQGGQPSAGFGSLKFDGTDDRVVVANTPRLNTWSEMTVSFWMKQVVGSTYGAAIGKSTASYVIYVGFPTAGKITPFVAASSQSSTNAIYTQGVWTHVAITYNGATLDFYIDGVQKETHAYAHGSVSEPSDVLIGVSPFSEYFTGELDDVCFFNRALPSSEMAQCYSDVSRGSPGTLNWLSPRAYNFGVTVPPEPPSVSSTTHIFLSRHC